MMKKTLLAILTMACFACSKDESSEQGPRITLQQAVDGNAWKITAVKLTTSDGGFLDLFNTSFADCEKDDILRFNTGGGFVLDDGVMSCGGSGRTVFYNLNGGNWGVSAADSTLGIARGFNNQVYKVTRWSEAAMTWTQVSTNYLGVTETLTYSLTR